MNGKNLANVILSSPPPPKKKRKKKQQTPVCLRQKKRPRNLWPVPSLSFDERLLPT